MLTKSDIEVIKTLIRDGNDSVLGQFEVTFDKKLKPIKKDIRKIKKDVSSLIKRDDENDVYLHRRVLRIEEHLKIETPQN